MTMDAYIQSKMTYCLVGFKPPSFDVPKNKECKDTQPIH